MSATGAHALGLESPAAVFNYSSDTPIPALLTIEDYYGQVVSGGLPEATTLIRVETADEAELEGQTSLPTVRGRAEFTGLTVRQPGTGSVCGIALSVWVEWLLRHTQGRKMRMAKK